LLSASSLLAPPVAALTLTSINQTYSQGDTVTLECTSEKGDNIYQWQKNGMDLDGEELPILRLLNITYCSGGKYTCVVSNSLGSINASTFVFVYPYFLSQPGDMQVSVDAKLLLLCNAVGFPRPEYLWRRVDGRQIRGDIMSDKRILNITNVQFGDEGEYYCVASGRGIDIQSQISLVSGNMVGFLNHFSACEY
jgi:hypothetical protein